MFPGFSFNYTYYSGSTYMILPCQLVVSNFGMRFSNLYNTLVSKFCRALSFTSGSSFWLFARSAIFTSWMICSTFFFHIPDIVSLCSKPKVSRIDTKAGVARMTHRHILKYWPIVQLVRKAMYQSQCTVNSKLSIPVCIPSALPYPAWCTYIGNDWPVSINLSPKLLPYRLFFVKSAMILTGTWSASCRCKTYQFFPTVNAISFCFHKNTPFAPCQNLLSTQIGRAKGVRNDDTTRAMIKQLTYLCRPFYYNTPVLILQ